MTQAPNAGLGSQEAGSFSDWQRYADPEHGVKQAPTRKGPPVMAPHGLLPIGPQMAAGPPVQPAPPQPSALDLAGAPAPATIPAQAPAPGGPPAPPGILNPDGSANIAAIFPGLPTMPADQLEPWRQRLLTWAAHPAATGALQKLAALVAKQAPGNVPGSE